MVSIETMFNATGGTGAAPRKQRSRRPRSPAPSTQVRRRRPGQPPRRTQPSWRPAALGIALLAVIVVSVWTAAGSGGKPRASGRQQRHHARAAAGATGLAAPAGYVASQIPAVEAGLYPWQLQAPVSREVVLPEGPAGTLVVAGGLTQGGGSASGAYRLDTANGQLTLIGNLASPTHDAAAALVGQTGFVFGGGTAVPAATTQGLSATGTSSNLSPLPQPRADAAAAVVDGVAYLVGGYNGAQFDAAVLATTDGLHYRSVATLPVPVRYPAVAAVGGLVYVFGGLGASGTPVRAVQVVDPRTGTAKVVAQLPFGLAGASAGALDGYVYVAGGVAAPAAGAGGASAGNLATAATAANQAAGASRASGGTTATGGAATGGAASATATGDPVTDVFAFDPAKRSLLEAGHLPAAVAYAGSAVAGGRLYIVGGEVAGGAETTDVQFVKPDSAFGVAGAQGAGSPYYGYKLLVADRGNDRLLVLDDTGRIVWTYPSPSAPPPPGGFYFPDDAFFIRHGTAIISNQEENETIVEIAFPSGRILWSYGHPHQAGSAPGYLNNPDDAYLLRNGDITVADPMNCRVLIIDPATKTVLHQIGTNGACTHDPPYDLGSPNGDTPLADGNLLISEINGSWVDEYTPSGQLVWDAHLAIGYPSDPQQIGPDRYLIADYVQPGAIIEFNRAGQILYRYQPTSGPGELNEPSLVELLPTGVFMLNDDHNDRMVAIDPSTGAIVWQYGHTGLPGRAPGYLFKPDGFDLLGPGGTTPTHPVTG